MSGHRVRDRWRVLTAARVFALAAAFGLAVATETVPDVGATFLALCVLAVVMSISGPAPALQAVAPIAEGTLVALVLVSVGETTTTPLMLYLAIPAFVAGLQVGGRWPFAVVASECVAAIAALVAARRLGDLDRVLEHTGPWVLVGLGLGLLGAWMHSSGGRLAGDQDYYESAHRLLGQLRAVSRRLSSGLDTSALAEQLATQTLHALGGSRATVLVHSESGTMTQLGSAGGGFDESLHLDPTVQECCRSHELQSRSREEAALVHVRTVFPLRVGARIIGVVVVDSSRAMDEATMARLLTQIDEHSLRLETALLFDEVRSTATMEERNRLAREIHDGVAQEIASLGYLVDDLGASAPTPEGQARARELRQELSRVVSELRLSIFDLRSDVHPQAGLGLALSDHAREVGKRAGMTVHLALSERPQRLHLVVETELLRIAQEAITNARKHAHASNLWITLNTESPIIIMRIEDDGVGSAGLRDDHYGLRIMRERAERLGGELTIAERPRGGTSVVVTVWPPTTTPPGEHDDDLSLAR